MPLMTDQPPLPIKLDSVGLVDQLNYYKIVTDAAESIQPGCTN